MRIWTAALFFFLHLAFSPVGANAQANNQPSDGRAIPPGTTLVVVLAAPLDRRTAKVGGSFTVTVDRQVIVQN